MATLTQAHHLNSEDALDLADIDGDAATPLTAGRLVTLAAIGALCWTALLVPILFWG
jgi:hypothetical protein